MYGRLQRDAQDVPLLALGLEGGERRRAGGRAEEGEGSVEEGVREGDVALEEGAGGTRVQPPQRRFRRGARVGWGSRSGGCEYVAAM